MHPDWQKINDTWHICHSWQESHGRRITAMTTFLVLLALAGIAYTGYLVSLLRSDGYGHRAASGLPRSHRPDAFEPRWLA
jgi:hypothetical protein